jgi:hypothetical protein
MVSSLQDGYLKNCTQPRLAFGMCLMLLLPTLQRLAQRFLFDPLGTFYGCALNSAMARHHPTTSSSNWTSKPHSTKSSFHREFDTHLCLRTLILTRFFRYKRLPMTGYWTTYRGQKDKRTPLQEHCDCPHHVGPSCPHEGPGRGAGGRFRRIDGEVTRRDHVSYRLTHDASSDPPPPKYDTPRAQRPCWRLPATA